MFNRKSIILLALLPVFLAVFLLATGSPAGASPALQMTPGADLMAVPTVSAPTPLPGDPLTNPSAGASQVNCPMMSGSMGVTGVMTSTGMTTGSPMMGSPMMGGSMTGGSMTGGSMMGGSMMGSPMMGGSMTGGSMMGGSMMGQGGMAGMGMQGMQQMGTMPMTGMQTVNDALSAGLLRSWFYSINPWWVLGWMLLIGLALGILALLVVAVILAIRQVRKNKPAAA
jgi:hypothetical protein